jgi:dehydrogenase/reductase SDR family member 7B
MMFQNKRVWITGASSGIGEALAMAFAEQGANLILSARNENELQRVRAACSKNAKEITVVPLDIAEHDAIFATAKQILTQFGKIDILINNAGISQRDYAKNTGLDVDRRLFEVNYLGTIAMTKALLPSMILHQLGHIVTITSATGKIGTPLRSSYAASKHALHGFMDSLRAEIWQDNIDVTLVCPGFIRTNISRNALMGDGSAQGTMDAATDAGMSPDRLAKKILRAVAAKKEEVYFGGFKEVLAIYLKRYTPGLFSKILRKIKVT